MTNEIESWKLKAVKYATIVIWILALGVLGSTINSCTITKTKNKESKDSLNLTKTEIKVDSSGSDQKKTESITTTETEGDAENDTAKFSLPAVDGKEITFETPTTDVKLVFDSATKTIKETIVSKRKAYKSKTQTKNFTDESKKADVKKDEKFTKEVKVEAKELDSKVVKTGFLFGVKWYWWLLLFIAALVFLAIKFRHKFFPLIP